MILQHTRLPVFSVQYHPEASPGPHDSRYLFHRFVALMERLRPVREPAEVPASEPSRMPQRGEVAL